jgi:VanZ family protein
MSGTMNAANSILSVFRYLGLGALIAIGVLSEVPGGLRPHISAVTQLEHFVAYFAAALLLALGFWNRRNMLLLCLALPIYAAVLEIAQMFIPGRNSELIDFFASSGGACAGLISAWLLRSACRLTVVRKAFLSRVSPRAP